MGDSTQPDPGDLAERIVHLGGVLAAELDDLDGIPNDVVAADRLEPKGLEELPRPLLSLEKDMPIRERSIP